MGKRGNIQQAYPSMEYRFFPELLRVTTDDVVCLVWSGKSFWLNDQIAELHARALRARVCGAP